MLPISIVVLTYNAEATIGATLASARRVSDDIHVVDSFSTDRTLEIATAAGAQVVQHPFDNYGAQRNWAIDTLPLKYPWELHLDADERLSDELVAELGRLFASEVPADIAPPEKLTDVYALRVRGQSMIDALIDDGDIVLMRRQETAENGQMVAVRIEDENAVTLKKFYREGDRVRLQPANTTMEPIYVNPASVRIEGRVVGVLRSML